MKHVSFWIAVCVLWLYLPEQSWASQASSSRVDTIIHYKNNLHLDTNTIYKIPEVNIMKVVSQQTKNSTVPTQRLTQKVLAQISVLQVSDAVKFFTGVTVKDYGGIGGLKTISVRSLGAEHTAVAYDGIPIDNAQSGQIDIGRFSLDHVNELQLSNAQSDQIFQPASLFASGSVLSIKTMSPRFEKNTTFKGHARLKAGSFGLINPSLSLSSLWSKHWTSTLSLEYLTANGKYPYTLHYGEDQNDLTTQETRKNTDVENLRAETALFYKKNRDEAQLRFYMYNSERGLPGATIFYNTDNFSSQRLWNNTFFFQGHYLHKINQRLKWQVNAKYNNDFMRYLDPAFLNSAGKEDDRYLQQEYYASGSIIYRPTEQFSINYSSDAQVNNLTANQTDFSNPERLKLLNVLALKYTTQGIKTTASLLHTATFETVEIGQAADNQSKFSPFMGVSVRPFENHDISFRAFYKDIFRLPTFNDLYYTNVGNRDLKPETTHQFNLGSVAQFNLYDLNSSFIVSLDVYHNTVKNKIVAFPSKDIFNWTMLNYGEVTTNGLDFTGEYHFQPNKKYQVSVIATYTYLRALNTTDENSRTYEHQIPYTPRTSGSGKVSLTMPWFSLSYSMVWSGDRYAVNQNYAENRVEGYSDHSIKIQKDWKSKHLKWNLGLECLNLTDQNYEVVRYFPMPGRSYRATVTVFF